MRTKLLFVMPGLAAGGGEKSLVNLLSQMDYSRFEVDLFLFNNEGLFMEFLPPEVRLVQPPDTYRLFSLPIGKAVWQLLKRGLPRLAMSRILYSWRNLLGRGTAVAEQYSWRYMSPAFKPLEERYDVAIGFLEKTSTYFCVDKVSAAKKIGWVHIDYDKLGMDPRFDIRYFEKLDEIVTVSEECAEVLKQRFPEQSDKVKTIYNIVSPKVIRAMVNKEQIAMYERHEDEVVILSIGRLHHQKGFELAVEACARLTALGYRIRWYVIGEGEERERLTALIRQHGLQERFILLGLKANPYPYLQQADVYAQPSRFEGKSIAIDEAKILHKPIVVTDFSTAKDQITDGVDGLIVAMNPDSMAEGIARLIDDREVAGRISAHLANQQLGTEDEIYKLYKLFA